MGLFEGPQEILAYPNYPYIVGSGLTYRPRRRHRNCAVHLYAVLTVTVLNRP